MYIAELNLQNYRNYIFEHFEFSEGLNVLAGMNAQGKTNAVEAVFYLCTGYSPRVTRDSQLINYNADCARFEASAVSKRIGTVTSSVSVSRTEGKKITVNGAPAAKAGELLGNINSVLFNPQELRLVQESPEDRRRFMDIALSQLSKSYFNSLQKYRKILSQRNALLKEYDKELVLSTLPVWDAQLAAVACKIIFMRNEFLTQLKPLCEDAHSRVTGGEEKLEISRDYKFDGSEEEICSQLSAELFERMERDMAAGFTSVGPHRDDIKIKINGEDARIYASQGQQRTAALSLKLAETELFCQRFGEYPVLILDDALSELDSKRRERLLSMLSGIQTIATCTDAELLSLNGGKLFSLSGGKIINKD